MSQTIKDIKYKLRILFDPSYWLMNNRDSEDWDNELTKALESGCYFTEIDPHTANFAGRCIWIENHPYASFTLHSRYYCKRTVRPSRVTIMKLRERLEQSILLQKDKETP